MGVAQSRFDTNNRLARVNALYRVHHARNFPAHTPSAAPSQAYTL